MATDSSWSTFHHAPSIRRMRPSTGVAVRWTYSRNGRSFDLEVHPNRTVVTGDSTSFLEFGYQSLTRTLSSPEGIAGRITGEETSLQQVKGLGITRKSSRVFLRSSSSELYWEKTGVLRRLGTAHACYRGDGTKIARTSGGFRKLEIHQSATNSEAIGIALSYASSATEECARAGLSSLFWF